MKKAFLEQQLEDALKLAKHWEEQAAFYKARTLELEQDLSMLNHEWGKEIL